MAQPLCNQMTPAAGLPSDGLFAGNASFHTALPTGASMTQPMTSQMILPLPAAAAHPHRPVYRGPSYAMTAVMSLRSSVAPPGHCVPGTPEPPSASAVLVPLHMLLRYDYLAGSLGGGVPLVPDRSACTRYRIPAIPVPVRIRGRSPGRAADSWFLFAPVRTRAVTMPLPVRIRGWSPSRTAGSWASLSLSPDSS
jgi:hypothetical protein